MLRRSRAALLMSTALGILGSACADLDAPFVCKTDMQCGASKMGIGVCEANHACSFPDGQCASGRRYGALGSADVAKLCTGSVPDAGTDRDLGEDGLIPVAHIVPAQKGGTGDLTITVDGTIDTTSFYINGDEPSPGITFELGHEATSGAELAILRVGAFSLSGEATLTVTGSRPLVVVATSDIQVAGIIAAHATLATEGPGGAKSGMGAGAGASSMVRQLGAAGAGYGTEGGLATNDGDGGVGSAGGSAYGDDAITVLVGGSGGGADQNGVRGGAGGGAIQLTSATRVSVVSPGGINAGGGGAPAGMNYSNGSGGGSGGSIVLQAPTVLVSGTLAANGGAGRGCASDSNTVGNAADGALSTASAAGSSGGYGNGPGGPGGSKSSPAGGAAAYSCAQTGGGGGGAVGRIAVLYRTQYSALGVTSPTEHAVTY